MNFIERAVISIQHVTPYSRAITKWLVDGMPIDKQQQLGAIKISEGDAARNRVKQIVADELRRRAEQLHS